MATFDAIKNSASTILNKFAGWLLFFAICWLCWGLARIVWLILAPPVAPNLPLAERHIQATKPVNVSNALTIFEVSKPQIPDAPKMPPPDVGLVGVMLAQPSSLSSAMLEVNGVIANYRVGELLKGSDYKVLEVAWEQVIIADANDRQIVLDMPERMNLNQGQNLDGSSANTSNSRGISNRRLPTRRSSVEALVSKDRLDEEQLEDGMPATAKQDNINEPTAESAIEKAVSEIKKNPASYLSQMGVMATGEGYQVTDAMPSKLKNRLGLESGDRVMSVNGQTVGANPMGDADLLTQVKQSGEAVIEVKRGEQIITIRQQF